MESINFADLFTWYVAFLFSFTAHEASHALAAMKGGDYTAYLVGQVTLNPIPHIKRSPFGTVVVPLISFFLFGWMLGWASAPYDPHWAARHPRKAAWMAAAGPAANLTIAVLAFFIMKLGLAAEVFSAPMREQISFTSIVVAEQGMWFGLAKLLSVLLILNLILFIFNLFPFPPLDGHSVITLFMSDQTALKFKSMMSQPAFSFLGIILAWRAFPYVFREVFSIVFRLLHPEF
ncbi:MAG: site-2 protease family protein [bacterium]